MIVEAFAAASIRVGTPLALAAIGESIAEKSGVINLGIEGSMLAGAFGAAVGASHGGLAVGVAAGAVAGFLVAALFAAVSIGARANQIIAGTAVTLVATGLTGLLAQKAWGTNGAGLTLPTFAPIPIPILSDFPVIGTALFRQSLLTYLCYVIIPAAGWFLFRTRYGLELRACGESPSSAVAAGVPVARVRTAATLIGGVCAGLAGATLVLAQVGTFTERMTGGRGFIAIAIVVLGRWTPFGVAGAELVFGAASALQTLAQTTGWAMPYQLPLAFPYLLTLVLLASSRARATAPAALGQRST